MTNDIALILKDWLKVIKVVSMYPANNSLPQSLRRSFAEKLVSIIDEMGDVAIAVSKDSLIYNEEVVYQDSSKEDALASMFFQTGITGFTFKAGLDVEEIDILLDIFKEYQNSTQKNKDLVSMIWEAGLQFFHFNTVEDIALREYSGNIDFDSLQDSSESGPESRAIFGRISEENYNSIFEVSDDEVRESSVVDLDEDSKITGSSSPGGSSISANSTQRAMRSREVAYQIFGVEDKSAESSLHLTEAMDAMGYAPKSGASVASKSMENTPNTAMVLNNEIELSESENETIEKLLDEDSQFDMYESTSELLKEMLYQETEFVGFSETVTICEKIMTEFISAGRIMEAGLLLRFLDELKEKVGESQTLWAERLRETLIVFGSKEKLSVLADALNDTKEIGAGVIKQYLDNFGWEAINGLSSLLDKLKYETHKSAFCDFLALKGKHNLNVIANGLSDKNPDMVISSIVVLSKIGDDESVRLLSKMVDHPNENVRKKLISSLVDVSNEKTIALLVKLARDKEETIRRGAVRCMSSKKGHTALEAIAEIINDDSFDNIDNQDQQQLLNAFSILGGDQAVTYLEKLIVNYNMLNNDQIAFYRKAAFESLSLNRGEKAEKILLKLTGSFRPDIKKQARAAIFKRRSLIYGGDQ